MGTAPGGRLPGAVPMEVNFMTMRICDSCGANLDPCEACDCEMEKAAPGGNDTQDGNMGNNSSNNIPQRGANVNG